MLQFGSVRMGRLHHDVAPASRLGASSAIWLTKYAMPAERYARGAPVTTGLTFGQYRVPFVYSTNGEVIWFHCISYFHCSIDRIRSARTYQPVARRTVAPARTIAQRNCRDRIVIGFLLVEMVPCFLHCSC
jgi:hypothetical protein